MIHVLLQILFSMSTSFIVLGPTVYGSLPFAPVGIPEKIFISNKKKKHLQILLDRRNSFCQTDSVIQKPHFVLSSACILIFLEVRTVKRTEPLSCLSCYANLKESSLQLSPPEASLLSGFWCQVASCCITFCSQPNTMSILNPVWCCSFFCKSLQTTECQYWLMIVFWCWEATQMKMNLCLAFLYLKKVTPCFSLHLSRITSVFFPLFYSFFPTTAITSRRQHIVPNNFLNAFALLPDINIELSASYISDAFDVFCLFLSLQ